MKDEYIEEFIGFMKDIKDYGEITLYRYSIAMRDFDLNQISQDYINRYVQQRKNTSVIRGAMMCFFEFAGIKKQFDMPPKATGHKDPRKKRDISKDEYDAVSRHLYSKSFRDGLMFNIIYEGALRISDVKSIRLNSFVWDDFLKDGKPCKLVVYGKGRKSRTVLVNPETMEKILKHYSKDIDLGDADTWQDFKSSKTNLFRKNKKALSEYQIWKIIHVASIEAIGRDIRPHELRSARATELLDMGIPIHQVKTYLGHTSVATTEIYINQDDKKTISDISEIINQ